MNGLNSSWFGPWRVFNWLVASFYMTPFYSLPSCRNQVFSSPSEVTRVIGVHVQVEWQVFFWKSSTWWLMSTPLLPMSKNTYRAFVLNDCRRCHRVRFNARSDQIIQVHLQLRLRRREPDLSLTASFFSTCSQLLAGCGEHPHPHPRSSRATVKPMVRLEPVGIGSTLLQLLSQYDPCIRQISSCLIA